MAAVRPRSPPLPPPAAPGGRYNPAVSTAAVVVHLLTAPAAGAPMQSRASAELVPGLGIVGDRYAGGLGHWSDPRWPDQELTLIEFEVAADLALDPAVFRRNVVTR